MFFYINRFVRNSYNNVLQMKFNKYNKNLINEDNNIYKYFNKVKENSIIYII